MKKRILCISVAILLLCTSLTACAPQQEIDIIKNEWRRYVTDRTEKIAEIQMIGSGLDSNHNFIKDQVIIDEILDIFETLEISNVELWEDAPSEKMMFLTSLNVTLIPQKSDSNSISIHLKSNGEAYLNIMLGDTDYWAYISEWYIYDEVNEYKWIKQGGNYDEENK